MNYSKIAAFALLMMPTIVACGAKKEPATAANTTPSPSTQTSAPATEVQQKAIAEATDSNQGGGLAFSENIKKLCPGLKSPKFGFDSAELRGEWLDALKTLAACMESGNLSGKNLVLTGHTDPRGTDEYNMALGSERAEAVRRALKSFGVQEGRMLTTSRGKTDAKGTDEASWMLDRRVDIDLGS